MAKTVNDKIESIANLTPLQEGILFHYLMNEDDKTTYFIQEVFKFNEELNLENVEKSLELLSDKYDVLRTFFFYKNGNKPKQIVLKSRKIEQKLEDISDFSKTEQEKKIEKIKESDLKRGFNLEKDSLLRVTIIKLNDTEFEVVWSVHHIILDGWCIAILFKDFIDYYQKMNSIDFQKLKDVVQEEKKNVLQYIDYVKWNEQRMKTKNMTYWHNLLDDADCDSKIQDMYESIEKRDEKNEISLFLNEEIKNKLDEFSKMYNVTINTIMETVWGILLQKYNYSNDAIFGKVVSGRNGNISGLESAVRVIHKYNSCKS